jgi:hypothetical protein
MVSTVTGIETGDFREIGNKADEEEAVHDGVPVGTLAFASFLVSVHPSRPSRDLAEDVDLHLIEFKLLGQSDFSADILIRIAQLDLMSMWCHPLVPYGPSSLPQQNHQARHATQDVTQPSQELQMSGNSPLGFTQP